MGTALSYAFPANTFADTDAGDTLTYTATQSDDSALPSWLSFAAATRMFSGTPTAADVGTVSVKVTARDGNGGSVSDTFDIVVSAAATAPGAPTGLTATASGTTAIDLSWSAPGSTGGSAITGYKIEVSADGVSSWSDLVANTSNTTTTYAHTGLASGDTRHYRVSAINTNGTGVPSNVDSATTGTSVPGAPTGLTATASGATQIDLSWSAPAIHRRLRHHRLHRSRSPPTADQLDRPSVADTTSTDTAYAHTLGSAAPPRPRRRPRHYRVRPPSRTRTWPPASPPPSAPPSRLITAPAPTVANTIQDQTATAPGTALSYAFPANTFGLPTRRRRHADLHGDHNPTIPRCPRG